MYPEPTDEDVVLLSHDEVDHLYLRKSSMKVGVSVEYVKQSLLRDQP